MLIPTNDVFATDIYDLMCIYCLIMNTVAKYKGLGTSTFMLTFVGEPLIS